MGTTGCQWNPCPNRFLHPGAQPDAEDHATMAAHRRRGRATEPTHGSARRPKQDAERISIDYGHNLYLHEVPNTGNRRSPEARGARGEQWRRSSGGGSRHKQGARRRKRSIPNSHTTDSAFLEHIVPVASSMLNRNLAPLGSPLKSDVSIGPPRHAYAIRGSPRSPIPNGKDEDSRPAVAWSTTTHPVYRRSHRRPRILQGSQNPSIPKKSERVVNRVSNAQASVTTSTRSLIPNDVGSDALACPSEV